MDGTTTTRLRGAIALTSLALLIAPAHAAPSPGRYQVGPDTVEDRLTGLTWQRQMTADPYNHPDAIQHCNALSLDGQGWRLPAVSELLSLVDSARTNPALDPTVFPQPESWSGWTWASTIVAGSNPPVGWTMSLGTNGAILPSLSLTSESYVIRCVRNTPN